MSCSDTSATLMTVGFKTQLLDMTDVQSCLLNAYVNEPYHYSNTSPHRTEAAPQKLGLNFELATTN